MSWLGGLLAVAAVLLVAGGAAKTVRPRATANALGVAPWIVRAGALIELGIGLTALMTGAEAAAALVASSYAAFAAFVAWALWQDRPLATCACFGEADSPPTTLHLLIDAGLAVIAAVVAVTGHGRSLTDLGPAGVVGVAVAAYVTFLSLTSWPRLRAMTR